MLDLFLGLPVTDTKPEPSAYVHAWRPVGARAFDLAQVKEQATHIVRAAWPTFELI